MKQLVKELNIDGNCFQYIVSALFTFSYEIKAGVLGEPHIRVHLSDV